MNATRAEYEAMRELARTRQLNPEERARWDVLQDRHATDGIGQPPPEGHDSWEEYSLATRDR